MRQEHLAAIANLNTFAKNRASKSPSCELSAQKYSFNLHAPYVCKLEQPVLSSAGSEASSASRLSITSTAVDRQASNNAAAAEHSTAALGGNFKVNPEVDWSDEPLLACGPAAAAAADSNTGSTFGAGDWRQAGFRASNQHHQPLVGRGPDTFEHGSAANLKAVAPQLQTDQAQMQPTCLHSTRPLAEDMGYSSVASSAQEPAAVGHSTSAALFQSRTPAATASIASKASTSSSSSQQDNSVVLHSASTSSSSFYTHADSVVSKACSSPHHTGASVSRIEHHSFLQAPQRDVEAATSKSRAVHAASVQQGSTTSQIALTAFQVCGSAHSFGSCLHIAPD